MPASPKLMLDILEEHFEELCFLWYQRGGAVRSPAYHTREVLRLEDRIDAHLQGLLVGKDGLSEMLRPAIEGEDAEQAGGAAFVLLRMKDAGERQRVVAALEKSAGAISVSIAEAMSHAPAEVVAALRTGVERILKSQSASSAAAALVAGRHWPVALAGVDVKQHLAAEDANVRRCAWQTIAAAELPLTRLDYDRGLSDEDPGTRLEAIASAAWLRQAWLVDVCRSIEPAKAVKMPEFLWLRGVLSTPDDLEEILSTASNPAFGPARLELLGAYGDPEVVEVLLKEMTSANAADAAAAGAAYERITGKNVQSGNRVSIASAGGAGDDDFADIVALPDAQAAKEHWKQVRADYSQGKRVCCGFDVSKPRLPSAKILPLLDMRSRWEAYLRSRFWGNWSGTTMEMEGFPLGSSRLE